MTSLTRLVAVSNMKHDMVEQVKVALPAVAGTGLTFGLHEFSQYLSLAVGFATLLFVIIQGAYLIRKWYKREKHGWFPSKHDPDTE